MAGNAALPLFCDATGAVEEAQVGRFCELLHTRGFAIVRLPACAHAEAAAVRKAAGTFFALEKEEKRAVGDFRAIGDTYVGYRDTAATRQDCDAEFLEVRLESTTGRSRSRSHGLGPQPQPRLARHQVHLDSSGLAFPDPSGCCIGAAAQPLFVRLAAIARELLQLLASHIDVPPGAFLAPLDPPDMAASALPEGSLTATVLRLCHYRSRPQPPAAPSAAAAEGEVRTPAAAAASGRQEGRPARVEVRPIS